MYIYGLISANGAYRRIIKYYNHRAVNIIIMTSNLQVGFDVNIEVPLYNGTYKKIDEIVQGDILIGEYGFPNKVLEVGNKETTDDYYKVSFSFFGSPRRNIKIETHKIFCLAKDQKLVTVFLHEKKSKIEKIDQTRTAINWNTFCDSTIDITKLKSILDKYPNENYNQKVIERFEKIQEKYDKQSYKKLSFVNYFTINENEYKVDENKMDDYKNLPSDLIENIKSIDTKTFENFETSNLFSVKDIYNKGKILNNSKFKTFLRFLRTPNYTHIKFRPSGETNIGGCGDIVNEETSNSLNEPEANEAYFLGMMIRLIKDIGDYIFTFKDVKVTAKFIVFIENFNNKNISNSDEKTVIIPTFDHAQFVYRIKLINSQFVLKKLMESYNLCFDDENFGCSNLILSEKNWSYEDVLQFLAGMIDSKRRPESFDINDFDQKNFVTMQWSRSSFILLQSIALIFKQAGFISYVYRSDNEKKRSSVHNVLPSILYVGGNRLMEVNQFLISAKKFRFSLNPFENSVEDIQNDRSLKAKLKKFDITHIRSIANGSANNNITQPLFVNSDSEEENNDSNLRDMRHIDQDSHDTLMEKDDELTVRVETTLNIRKLKLEKELFEIENEILAVSN